MYILHTHFYTRERAEYCYRNYLNYSNDSQNKVSTHLFLRYMYAACDNITCTDIIFFFYYLLSTKWPLYTNTQYSVFFCIISGNLYWRTFGCGRVWWPDKSSQEKSLRIWEAWVFVLYLSSISSPTSTRKAKRVNQIVLKKIWSTLTLEFR